MIKGTCERVDYRDGILNLSIALTPEQAALWRIAVDQAWLKGKMQTPEVVLKAIPAKVKAVKK